MVGKAKRLSVNALGVFWFISLLSACGIDLDGLDESDSKHGAGKAGSPDVHINEVVASNRLDCPDENGKYPDWIELYNSSKKEVNLEGYAIVDNSDALAYVERLSKKLVVPAKGVKVFWADHNPELGPAHLPFKLKAGGEKVLLYGPDDKLLDRLDFADAQADESIARFPDGTGAFAVCGSPTCNHINGSSCVAD
jgi:hypothetical protein